MTSKDKFNNEIKKLSGFDDSYFGYHTYKVFPIYFNNEFFENVCAEMENKYPDAFEKYNDGKGG